MSHILLLESTIIAVQIKDIKALEWTGVTPDLTANCISVKKNAGLKSVGSKPRTPEFAVASRKKEIQVILKLYAIYVARMNILRKNVFQSLVLQIAG